MSVLSIQLFGKFCVRCDEKVVHGLEVLKEQELLSFLLVNRERPHARESLASLLWGDHPTEKSKKYLRQALWHLQSTLDAQAKTHGGMLLVEYDWVQLDLHAEFSLDVAVFERAYQSAQGAEGHDLTAAQVESLQQAVQLYKGDLLEGWYQDWCLYERERLQNMYLSMLKKLMSYCEARQMFEMGVFYGLIILRYDGAHERTHRQLMYLQYLAGDRTAALRQYERCAAALSEELGVQPNKHTTALYQQIRADHVEPPMFAKGRPSVEPNPALLSEVLGRLRQIQTILTDMQQHVQKDIKAVEVALNDPR